MKLWARCRRGGSYGDCGGGCLRRRGWRGGPHVARPRRCDDEWQLQDAVRKHRLRVPIRHEYPAGIRPCAESRAGSSRLRLAFGRACEISDYQGDRVGLQRTGRASAIPCSGDAVSLCRRESCASARLRRDVGRGGGLRCTSATTGLTCRNQDGHGFFLSRENWATVLMTLSHRPSDGRVTNFVVGLTARDDEERHRLENAQAPLVGEG